jgi:hypothetical protein
VTEVERKTFFPPVSKVPRQCPLVLLVKVNLRQAKALGSEEGEGLGSGFFYEQMREV